MGLLEHRHWHRAILVVTNGQDMHLKRHFDITIRNHPQMTKDIIVPVSITSRIETEMQGTRNVITFKETNHIRDRKQDRNRDREWKRNQTIFSLSSLY